MGVAPRATYRLQLHAGFDFDDAAAVVPYLARLGVSHLYLSPVTSAVPGSTHGYDVADPTRVSDELGGEEALARLDAAARAHGLGVLLDIVPNHMSADPRANRWWRDVLEDGRTSPFAAFFDIDWETTVPHLRGRVLLPVLAGGTEREVRGGSLRVERHGDPVVAYHDHRLPLAWEAVAPLLREAASAPAPTLAALEAAVVALPAATAGDVVAMERRRHHREALRSQLRALLETPAAAAALDGVLAAVSADPARLLDLLDRQHYRLASWRDTARRLNYRRFFTITSLVGVRVEDERVMAAIHALPLRLVREGVVDGLRIDHVDGLRDPAGYLRRLRDGGAPDWVVVEKILADGEDLPRDWRVDGTTGYEFAARVAALLADPAAEEAFTRLYEELTGRSGSFDDVLLTARRRVLETDLAGEVARATALLGAAGAAAVPETARRAVVVAVLGALPVYRTYAACGGGGDGAEGRAAVDGAAAAARARDPGLDPAALHLLATVMRGETACAAAAELCARLQQLSPVVMAKGLEDTALYRWNRLVALNDVGLRPTRFGMTVADFHDECRKTQERSPRTLLATSTHDTKRSEDVRVRLLALTGMPTLWEESVRRWSAAAGRHRSTTGRPDRDDEYVLLQALVGAHPLGVERATAYMAKAAREAAVHTTWTEPDSAYEDALHAFVRGVCGDRALMDEVAGFVEVLDRRARILGLAQTLLHCTCPGVPDIYQGTEVREMSLVDPDNRRPIAYGVRADLLERARAAAPEEALADTGGDLAKMMVVERALALRARRPEAFDHRGDHHALVVEGPRADDVVAFARGAAPAAVVVAPRRARPEAGWADTVVHVPRGRWRDVLTGDRTAHAGPLGLDVMLRRFCVALLERVDE